MPLLYVCVFFSDAFLDGHCSETFEFVNDRRFHFVRGHLLCATPGNRVIDALTGRAANTSLAPVVGWCGALVWSDCYQWIVNQPSSSSSSSSSPSTRARTRQIVLHDGCGWAFVEHRYGVRVELLTATHLLRFVDVDKEPALDVVGVAMPGRPESE